MATNGERPQKVGTEAFQKLRSDHEQFLEAYEKPTQIYRFLKARHSLKPRFLHRNLSYMQHLNSRRKTKRLKKLRVDDLIKHTTDVKPDLASEIKSDNHLKISFVGLEKGVNFRQSLAKAKWQSSEPTASPETRNGVPMVVEVLLYRFNHPSTEALLANPNSYPCTCTTLGKFSVNYNPVSGNCTPTSTAPSLEDAKTAKDAPALMIPESSLSWKGGDRTMGTQMLVFRARCPNRPATELKKLSKKTYRKNISIELNKLNHNDIASQIAKAKQQSHLQSQVSSSDKPGSGSTLAQQQQTSILEEGSDQMACNSPGMAQRRAKSKTKKEKRDACVMTDLTFGTSVIENLSPSPLSPDDMKVKQSAKHAGSSRLPKALPQSPTQNFKLTSALSSPPPHPKKGFTDKCTSPLIPRLPFKNGLNRLTIPNGYADVEEIEMPLPSSNSKVPPLKLQKSLVETNHFGACNGETETNGLCRKLFRKDPDTGEAIPSGEVFRFSKSEESSLIVSIPRAYYKPSRNSSTSSVSSEGRREAAYRRRSEIQLLLDGDKPKEHRISATEIPVFTAEDVANRSTRSAVTSVPSRGPWMSLGSSTRRITPVEHLSYPMPSFRTSIAERENRKRSFSDSDAIPSASSPIGPPTKQPRLEVETPVFGSMPETRSVDETQLPPKEGPNHAYLESKRDEASWDPALTQSTFCAELAVFDSRGECLLQEGNYKLLMQRCLRKDRDVPGLMTFAPLTWNTIFGAEKDEIEEESHNITLSFSLNWTSAPPKKKLQAELETALDLQRLREEYFPPSLSPPPPTLPFSPPPNLPSPPPTLPSPPPTLPSPPPTIPSSPPALPSPPATLSSLSLPTVASHPPSDLTILPLSTLSTLKEEAPLIQDEYESKPDVADTTPHKKRIIFSFLYHNNALQQTESRENLCCPWCALSCKKLYSLLKHMSLCHPRFLFTYTPVEDGMAIDVHVNKLYDATSSSPDPVERNSLSMVQRRRGPSRSLSCTALLVERCMPRFQYLIPRSHARKSDLGTRLFLKHAEVEEDLSEFLNDGTWKRGYTTNRMYHHSRSCLPLLPEEMERDSEQEEESLAWEKMCSQKMIEEFTDVNSGEKELMKLWNLFAMENRLIADKQIPAACVKFAQDSREVLVEKGIVQNFMAHLINLYDFGLISPSIIITSMDIVHQPPS